MSNPTDDLWWYYTIEFQKGKFNRGIYQDDMILLPRRNLASIDLRGMRALDICTMEGIIPTLMHKGGASEVYATDNARPADYPPHGNDSIDAMKRKISVVKSLHNVNWEYRIIPEKTPVAEHLLKTCEGQFDLLNLSGLLYHVYSPMHWLGSVRPLLKDGGLAIISTNVTFDTKPTMLFNAKGWPQPNLTTYWYISIPLFDYLLRYFRLMPLRGLYFKNEDGNGYLSAVCRATENVVADEDDHWMENSAWHSWDSKWFGGLEMAGKSQKSSISFKDGKPDRRMRLIDAEEVSFLGHKEHTAILKLDDIN